MTPEQLKTIDALVAKHVFGHDVVETKRGTYTEYTIGEPDNVYIRSEGSYELLNEVPSYSSDIAAAWEVVELLKQDWYDVTVSFDNEFIGGGWACALSAYDKEPIQAREVNTAPLAICLAALKAKGISVPE